VTADVPAWVPPEPSAQSGAAVADVDAHGTGIIGGGRMSGGGRDGDVVVVAVPGALGVDPGDPLTATKIASIDNRKPIAATITSITLGLGVLRSAMPTSIAAAR